MFVYLADGKDHAPCCQAKGIPAQCQELCSGNVIDIDYKYFVCLSYMNELSSCMMQCYGVLPSSPQHFRLLNISANFAVLHLDRPEKLGNTILDYLVNVQKLGSDTKPTKTYRHVYSPFILEGLESVAMYKVYVEPVNENGFGEPSSRQVFITRTNTLEISLNEAYERRGQQGDAWDCCKIWCQR